MINVDCDNILPPAVAAGLSVESIERIADHFRHAVGAGFADDMHELVKAFKGTVKVASPEDRQLDIHGTLEVRGKDDWTIYLASHTGPLQDRFTLAHEIGHYVLHSKMGNQPLRASRTFKLTSSPDIAESEADTFAFALLMPREKVLEAAKKYGKNPFLLSAEFEVDPTIADMRLKSLNLS